MDQDIVAMPPPPALTFTATRGAFLKLLLVNALLTVLTLGIYRFWAKTKVRRYLWSHIRFLDDPLEYTGTAGELFLGFLIVLAVLFPLGFVYTTIQTLVPPDSGWVHVALEVIYYLVLFALIQIGFYRAWRYRMSRTRWRGIRFGLDGSSWAYLKLASGWTLLTAITLGVAYPWMQVELWRYQMRHTHIGDQTVQFDGTGKELLVPWLITSAPAYLALGIIGFVFLAFGDTFIADSANPLSFSNDDPVAGGLMMAAFAIYMIVPILFFWFNIRLTRLQINYLSIGITTLTSQLPFGRLFWFASLALIMVAAAIAIPVLFAVTVDGFFGIGVFLFMAVLATLVLFPVLWFVIFVFEYLKCLIASTDVENPEYLEAVAQRPASEMKTGEGLADALDIGGL